MALEEPRKKDTIKTINDILVAVDPQIEPNIEDLTLDISGDKKGLSLLGETGNCC